MSDFGYDIDDTGSGASGFSFGVMFSVTAFLLIIVILFACTRLCLNQAPRRSRAFRSTDQNSALRPTDRYPTTIRQGLDEATLNSYPKLLYTEIKKANSTASCCSICLLDYKETDVLRALPDCAHLFHLNCIDPWMRLHPTCPICRTAPVRVPVQLPSVEVVQLAAREAS